MRTIAARLRCLEISQEETVERFKRQPPAVQRRVLDACAEHLSRNGHLPTPALPIATFRQQQPEAYRRWYTSTIERPEWFTEQHAALVPAFFAALREEMPYAL